MALTQLSVQGQTSFILRHLQPGGNFLWSISSGALGLVAVGDGGTILHSTNGATWVRRDSGTTDWLLGITFGNGKYVAVGERGRILISTDGIVWMKVVHGVTSARLNNVEFGGRRFVAVGEAGTIISSTDGLNWSPIHSGVTTWWRGLAYVPHSGANLAGFWITGQEGAIRKLADPTSPPLTHQTQESPPPLTGDLEAAVAIGTNFVAVGQGGDGIFDYTQTSASRGRQGEQVRLFSLHNFFPFKIGVQARYRGLMQGANALFATGENGVIMSSPNAVGPWTRIESGTKANLVAGKYAGNSLYIVGEDETIIQSTPLYLSRLLNISTRAQITETDVLISGFVVTGAKPKTVLVRAAGPVLRAFGVSEAISSTALSVLGEAGQVIAKNSGWDSARNGSAITAIAESVGAFPFPPTSDDSALVLTLNPGNYTAIASGAKNEAGVALIEVYDVDSLSSDDARVANIASRGTVGTESLIAGFRIGGAATRRVLVRGVGPSLARFGVDTVLSEPIVDIYRSTKGVNVKLTTVGVWSDQSDRADLIRAASLLSGAFALIEGSKDAAGVFDLAPGNYTAVVRAKDSTQGTALVEVYELP